MVFREMESIPGTLRTTSSAICLSETPRAYCVSVRRREWAALPFWVINSSTILTISGCFSTSDLGPHFPKGKQKKLIHPCTLHFCSSVVQYQVHD